MIEYSVAIGMANINSRRDIAFDSSGHEKDQHQPRVTCDRNLRKAHKLTRVSNHRPGLSQACDQSGLIRSNGFTRFSMLTKVLRAVLESPCRKTCWSDISSHWLSVPNSVGNHLKKECRSQCSEHRVYFLLLHMNRK
jgi:hypothetical protein